MSLAFVRTSDSHLLPLGTGNSCNGSSYSVSTPRRHLARRYNTSSSPELELGDALTPTFPHPYYLGFRTVWDAMRYNAFLATCLDVQAKSQASTTTVPPSSASSSTSSNTAFFATPPASLGVPADFTAAPFFATDFLKAFFPGFEATQTSVEPQPLITDPVSGTVFPLDLTNPKTIPTQNVIDPVVLPPSLLTDSPTVISPLANLSTPGSIQLRQNAFTEITEILNNTAKIFNSTCQQCISSLVVFKNLAHCSLVGATAFDSSLPLC